MQLSYFVLQLPSTRQTAMDHTLDPPQVPRALVLAAPLDVQATILRCVVVTDTEVYTPTYILKMTPLLLLSEHPRISGILGAMFIQVEDQGSFKPIHPVSKVAKIIVAGSAMPWRFAITLTLRPAHRGRALTINADQRFRQVCRSQNRGAPDTWGNVGHQTSDPVSKEHS